MRTGIKAFSLTELMIVLVIIAVIFSALAPIITKRHVADTRVNEYIWNYVAGDPEYSAYFDPGNPAWTSSVYMGHAPSSPVNNSGKLVIRANDIPSNGVTYKQPQIQFRFSNDVTQQSRGINAAYLYAGNSNNIVFGPSLSAVDTDNSTVYGLSNLNSFIEKKSGTNKFLSKAKSVTVLGYSAMGNAKVTEKGNDQHIIAIGNFAANTIGASDTNSSISGIFIGSGAGSGSAELKYPPNNNIAIGYNSMAYRSKDKAITGSNNVIVGVEAGNGLLNSESSYNTVIGSKYVGDGAYNTIIGYGAYNTDSATSRLTAIGYGACNSLSGTSGSRVCIGYKSGVSSNNTSNVYNEDEGEHIFIGGKPVGTGFPGRSVLEVHNNTYNNENYGNVVMNSNLVVRGNFYPSNLSSDGTSSDKISYNVFDTTVNRAAESEYSRCSDEVKTQIPGYSKALYICKAIDSNRLPKSRNLLYKGGDCNDSHGYTNGGKCPKILSSDIRLKTDIAENYDGLNKVLELKPYNYRYKNNLSVPMVGVIAQDLQKIFPDAVSKDSKGFLQIRWEDMFFAMVNAIKELSNKLDSIQEKLADISGDVLKIKQEHSSIKVDISLLNDRLKKLEQKRGVNGNN